MKVKPTVEKCELEEFLMMYHDAEGGLIVFEEDYKEFESGLKNISAHSVQEAKAETTKKIIKMYEDYCYEYNVSVEAEFYSRLLSTLTTKEES